MDDSSLAISSTYPLNGFKNGMNALRSTTALALWYTSFGTDQENVVNSSNLSTYSQLAILSSLALRSKGFWPTTPAESAVEYLTITEAVVRVYHKLDIVVHR